MMKTVNAETPLLIAIHQEGGQIQTWRTSITGRLPVSFEGFPLGSRIEIP